MKQFILPIICLIVLLADTNFACAQIYTGNPNDSIVGCNSGEVTHGYKSTASTISLTAEIGAGLIRTALTPNITYDFSLTTYKGHQFGISGSSYYFFQKNESAPFDMSMNHFLGFSYMRLNKKQDNFGFSLRYLLEDPNNDFNGDAFMLSASHMTSAWRISPSLIFSNNFKTAFPAITITHTIF